MMPLSAMFLSVAALAAPVGSPCTNDVLPRVYVEPMRTAASFDPSSKSGGNAIDAQSIALGREYLQARLARGGRPFTCTASVSNATHRVAATVSFLRSRENEFAGQTYGHSTKTTVWSLDVIVTLYCGSDILFAKAVTSTYEERRPISEAQFDNNIFHNLMHSAIEQAADEVIEFFEGEGGSPAASGTVPGLPAPAGTAGRSAPANTVPADSRPSLAILKPEAGDGVAEKEAMILWDLLESSARGGAFRIISRSDLPRMQEEIGFTTSSDLVDLSSQSRARIRKIKTVSKLLATSVGVVGETRVMTFKVFDASTAEIDAKRTRVISARSLDELLPQIPAVMAEIFAAPPSGFVLSPVAAVASMPKSVASAFDAELSGALSRAGIALNSGSKGRFRIVPSVASFYVRPDLKCGISIIQGSMSGMISVEGADVAPVPFSVGEVELGRETGAVPPWLVERYGAKLVSMALKDEAVQKRLLTLSNLK
ncbi:MAG: hypothetical protein II840_01210 [Kiritimatiellae bacterium]|nr:hypothetical protein [Kiritimatiellia bacterium]